ncbi:MAG: hotdog fold thioesterase [Chloroflexi bacterium]|nr:hotdog fold thioesterase [Chloroflexota bacterium]
MTPEERKQAIEDHIRTDPFAAFLGAELEAVDEGYSRVSLVVTEAMLNFHGITHGGLVFSLGDIGFAAASNSRGQTAVALNVTTSFLSATRAGDHLVAEVTEQHAAGPIATYAIVVTERQSGRLVAQSQAMVYRRKEFFVPPDEV